MHSAPYARAITEEATEIARKIIPDMTGPNGGFIPHKPPASAAFTLQSTTAGTEWGPGDAARTSRVLCDIATQDSAGADGPGHGEEA